MTPASPTPYDITDVPYITWQPGINTFLILIIFFCVVFAYLQWKHKRQKLAAIKLTPEKLLEEISLQQSSIFALDPKLALDRLTLATRRILSYFEGQKFNALTVAELEKLATGSELLTSIAQALKRLESLCYQSETDKESAQVCAKETFELLKLYVKSRNSVVKGAK